MIIRLKNGKTVEIEIDGDSHDELFVNSGTYTDSGKELTEAECMMIQDNHYSEIAADYIGGRIDYAQDSRREEE